MIKIFLAIAFIFTFRIAKNIEKSRFIFRHIPVISWDEFLYRTAFVKILRVPSFDIFATGVSEARQTLKLPFIGLPE